MSHSLQIDPSAPVGADGPALSPIDASHPTERTLGRLASNELGPRNRKKTAEHLEACMQCRERVSRLRELARRFRDLERTGIAAYGHALQAERQGRILRYE